MLRDISQEMQVRVGERGYTRDARKLGNYQSTKGTWAQFIQFHVPTVGIGLKSDGKQIVYPYLKSGKLVVQNTLPQTNMETQYSPLLEGL